MKFFVKSLATFFFTLLGGLFLANSTLAASTYTLSGLIKDTSGNGIPNATIELTNTSTNLIIGTTSSDSSGNYSMTVNEGVYNIQVIPPSGTNYGPIVGPNFILSSNEILNFTLVSTQSVTLSGHINDALGIPLAGQYIKLQQPGLPVAASSTSNSLGEYFLQVQPGTYNITISADLNDFSISAPQHYSITGQYTINQSIAMDINIPAKRFEINVKDGSNTPVPNTQVGTNAPTANNLLIGNNFTASGSSVYGKALGSSYPNPITDTNGVVVLWLFPANGYSFTATPPSNSGSVTTVVSGVSVVSDSTYTIVLSSPVVVSGVLRDPNGVTIPDQIVDLRSSSGSIVATTTTSASGNYVLQAAPGTYTLYVEADMNSFLIQAPQHYYIRRTISLIQDVTLDLTLPEKTINVHVVDTLGNSISDVELGTNAPTNTNLILGGVSATGSSVYGRALGSSYIGPKTDSFGNVTLLLFPTSSQNYSFTATPPNGSIYSTTTVSNISIVDDMTIEIVLPIPATLSGHIYDSNGNPLPGQTIQLQQFGLPVAASSTTNALGEFTLQTSAATYNLTISADLNDFSISAPQHYSLTGSYTLTQNTALDITLPVKEVNVHVQDELNNPIPNVEIGTNAPTASGLQLSPDLTVYGSSVYGRALGSSYPNPVTDASGNLTLWLFPTSGYKFTATPPAEGIYSTYVLENIEITDNQTEVISLQYNHNSPVTTSILSPSPNSEGTYPDPTTVSLSATAAEGYSIVNIYYTIDSGPTQIYTMPFTVSESGEHIITYWSADNSGVTENPNSTVFTIQNSIQISSLDPAKVWIGLKNSDDVGLHIDLLAEVYLNNILVTSGELDSVSAGSSGFNNAKLNTIEFNSFSPIDIHPGSQLSIKLSVRNACEGPSHNSGVARLWYNGSGADSQFGSTIGSNNNTYYLLNNFLLGTSVGTQRLKIDVQAGSKCSEFKPFGTWSINI